MAESEFQFDDPKAAFAECEKIYAAECMADVEKKRAVLLKGLEDLERERAHILAGWLPVNPTPEMKATGQVREGIRILGAASERGDKLFHRELEFILRDALWNLLRRAADGDDRAFRALLALLGSCIEQLYDLRHRQPEMVRKFAARRTDWPGFLTVDPDGKKMNTEFAHYWKSDAYKEPTATPGIKELKSNARALIRRDIKRNIKQAFRSIAPKSSAV